VPLICPLANQRRSVYDLLSSLKSQAASILRHLQGSASYLSDDEKLAQTIVDLFQTVESRSLLLFGVHFVFDCCYLLLAAVARYGAPLLAQMTNKMEVSTEREKRPVSLEERYKLNIKPLLFGTMEIKSTPLNVHLL
jgi:hypothetical protein